MTNLAADPRHAATLGEMRARLADWERRTGDRGREPEPAAMYDSDMRVYLGGAKTDTAELVRNIALNKRWAAEGK